MNKDKIKNYTEDFDNPYLIMGFWEFAIVSTLMVVFFPWSLLFCVFFFGLSETKLILQAMLHDALKTLMSIISIIFFLIIIIGFFALLFS